MRTLFVPSLGLDLTLLERLAASIDCHVDFKVVWNNGALGALESFARTHRDWIVKDSAFGNIGVAGAWNEAAKLFPDEPTILIVNEDSFFLPGYLEIIRQCADDNYAAPLIHLNDSNSYYAFISTRAGREEFGTFDENFFVYLEDCDMRVRHRLMGVTTYPYALQGLPSMPHGKPRTGGVNYAAFIQAVGLFNRAYWLRKWGSFNFEQAEYQTPYRDHRLKPSEWVWDPAHRAKIHPLWETFMSLPNPSIYD